MPAELVLCHTNFGLPIRGTRSRFILTGAFKVRALFSSFDAIPRRYTTKDKQ